MFAKVRSPERCIVKEKEDEHADEGEWQIDEAHYPILKIKEYKDKKSGD